MSKTTGQIGILELVYPPISNQEAIWLEKDGEVEAILRRSDFYIICNRSEIKYSDYSVDQDAHVISFRMSVQGGVGDAGEISLRDLPAIREGNHNSYSLELGPKLFRVWDKEVGEADSQVLEWFTTEKLLYDRWHHRPGINGLDRYRDMATYDLSYVGIAKDTDSFKRLIAGAHKKRAEILGNEPQRYPGARVSDETYLFLFRIEPLGFRTFDSDYEFESEDLNWDLNAKRIVADAEKAFVKLLDPTYNCEKYKNYPRGVDGLYSMGIDRYGYVIGEDITLITPTACIKGGYNESQGLSDDADFVFIEGDEVTLLISRADYPPEDPDFSEAEE